MANERLYLRCRWCGQTMYVAKHFMSPWSITCEPKDITEFIEQHGCCYNVFGFGDDDVQFGQIEFVSQFGDGFPEIIEDKVIKGNWYTKVKRETYQQDQQDQQDQKD